MTGRRLLQSLEAQSCPQCNILWHETPNTHFLGYSIDMMTLVFDVQSYETLG